MSQWDKRSGFHHSLFRTSIDGIIVIDKYGVIQDANEAVVELFQYEVADLIGQNIKMLMPQPHRDKHDGYISRYQETKEARIIGIGREVPAMRKDGRIFPIRLAVSEFETEGQVFYTGVVHDMTEENEIKRQLREYANELEHKVRKRTESLEMAQEQLLESQKLYEAMATNFPNGTIGVLDREFNILFMEGSDLKEMGFDSKRLIGENYLSLLPEDVQEEVKAHLQEVFAGEHKVFEVSSSDRIYLGRSVPLPDEAGRIERILQVDIDVTREKRAEQEVFNALKKERELNDMKSSFVSMASHEFRTPLSSILSSASLIARYDQTEGQDKRLRHIQKIKSNVENLNQILNDFLSLEKIETGVISNAPKSLNIKELIEEILEETSPLQKAGQSVVTQFDHQTEEVLVDPFLLRNILNNLLSNAYKYSEEGKTVQLRTSENGSLEISVSDQGIGISEEDQEKLFTRFYRASNATNIQGTGLGLNIVQRYARLMDASISFESELNKGSTFTLVLTIDNEK